MFVKHVLKNIVGLAAVMTPCIALAQAAEENPCDNLAENETWMKGFSKLQQEITDKEYNEALRTANSLVEICADSPILNYYIGISFRETGDKIKATSYFQKASAATSDYAVAPEIARRMWYARYESEYPERTQDSVDKIKSEKKALEDENKALAEKLAELKTVTTNDMNSFQRETHSHYKAIMWTGVGIGIAGLLATAGGIVFAAKVDNHVYNPTIGGSNYKVSPSYIAGWSVAGLGAGLAIAGAITTGIAGYHVTHMPETAKFDAPMPAPAPYVEPAEQTDDADVPASETIENTASDNAMGFFLLPNGAGFQMTF